MIWRVVIFLVLNFGALGLGSYLMDGGVVSDWYQNLDKAPWTPPGWVFGAVWTSIMVFFAFYMSYLWDKVPDTKMVLILFIIQWILNVSWNPLFFKHHFLGISLIVIISLTFLVIYFFFKNLQLIKYKSLLILPYLVWMIIATSLNAYAWVKN